MTVLAAGVVHHGLWYPEVIGVLAVAAGITLFCGSVYVLLGTNLGARLGFLVAFTGLMGWMVILTTLWMTTASPLNTLRGRLPQWTPLQVVDSLGSAKVQAVRGIANKAHTANATDASDVKAFVDGALVTKKDTAVQTFTAADNKFAEFDDSTKYKVTNTYIVGGSDPNLFDWTFTHKPKYAVAEFCPALDPTKDLHLPFGTKPPDPECKPGVGSRFIVMERDLGTVRQPVVFALIAAVLLFGLGLLGLHWREKDEAAAEAAATMPAGRAVEPVPAGV